MLLVDFFVKHLLELHELGVLLKSFYEIIFYWLVIILISYGGLESLLRLIFKHKTILKLRFGSLKSTRWKEEIILRSLTIEYLLFQVVQLQKFDWSSFCDLLLWYLEFQHLSLLLRLLTLSNFIFFLLLHLYFYIILILVFSWDYKLLFDHLQKGWE